ncbi:MAG: endo-1,4-beta-xylanase, partial [Oscillospiraceae bacterium]|nr:endo-1,4-beta-xylanase [Oscillospiraceae bacterium]
MINVKILEANGACASREELLTLYASDLKHEPFKRQSVVMPDGTVALEAPPEPCILHAKLRLPGYGHMWVSADNGGDGYKDGDDLNFIREAARSRVAEVEAVIRGGEFVAGTKCLSMLSDAKTLLDMAKASPQKHDYHLTALIAGLWAGELAAVERARARIAKRKKKERFLFGCGGFQYPYSDNPAKKVLFDSLFNYATLPFYLDRLEKVYGEPDYSNLDRLQDAFEANGIPTKAHPMWWPHKVHGMPPWMQGVNWRDGSLEREINRVISRSVQRYKGRIHYYDAINEAHDWCNVFNLTREQEGLMTKLCCDAIHNVDPDAHTVVNTCFLFGENVADGKVQWGLDSPRIMTPYTYLEQVHACGTQYDSIGIQLYCPSRDMLAIDKLFERYAAFQKPIHLTELGVPSMEMRVPPNTLDGRMYCLNFMYHGYWREEQWSERLQADWIEDF